jgi:uncharacterized membrane protein
MSSNPRGIGFWNWIPLIFVAGIVSIFAIGVFFRAAFYPATFFPWWILLPLFFFGLFFFFASRWGCGWGWRYNDLTSLEILRERFARADISKAQYDEMRKELEGVC